MDLNQLKRKILRKFKEKFRLMKKILNKMTL